MMDAVLEALAADGVTFGAAATALATGFLLGAFFFGALWWTSRRVLFTAAPGLFLTLSFIVRMAVLLGGIWFVTKGRLLETFLSVVGVLIARRSVMGAVQRSGGDGGAGLAPGPVSEGAAPGSKDDSTNGGDGGGS